MNERGRQVAEVLAHQRHVSGLDRDVGTERTHGDADVRGRQRRSVVDAIADHRHPALSPKLLDDPGLVLRA